MPKPTDDGVEHGLLLFHCYTPSWFSLLRWRSPHSTHGDVDRHGKPNTDEEIILGGIDDSGNDANDLSIMVEQRSTRISRVHRRINLDQSMQHQVTPRNVEITVKPGYHPELIEPYKPKGLPTA
jgi:hypothetical protein